MITLFQSQKYELDDHYKNEVITILHNYKNVSKIS